MQSRSQQSAVWICHHPRKPLLENLPQHCTESVVTVSSSILHKNQQSPVTTGFIPAHLALNKCQELVDSHALASCGTVWTLYKRFPYPQNRLCTVSFLLEAKLLFIYIKHLVRSGGFTLGKPAFSSHKTDLHRLSEKFYTCDVVGLKATLTSNGHARRRPLLEMNSVCWT